MMAIMACSQWLAHDRLCWLQHSTAAAAQPADPSGGLFGGTTIACAAGGSQSGIAGAARCAHKAGMASMFQRLCSHAIHCIQGAVLVALCFSLETRASRPHAAPAPIQTAVYAHCDGYRLRLAFAVAQGVRDCRTAPWQT